MLLLPSPSPATHVARGLWRGSSPHSSEDRGPGALPASPGPFAAVGRAGDGGETPFHTAQPPPDDAGLLVSLIGSHRKVRRPFAKWGSACPDLLPGEPGPTRTWRLPCNLSPHPPALAGTARKSAAQRAPHLFTASSLPLFLPLLLCLRAFAPRLPLPGRPLPQTPHPDASLGRPFIQHCPNHSHSTSSPMS